MGWKSKLRKLKRKLKKIKLKKIAKGIKKLASGASALLPAPFSTVANVVEKSIKGLQKADQKIKAVKKSIDDHSSADKNTQLINHYNSAKKHWKSAIKYKQKGDKKNAYLQYHKAVFFKKQGDKIK